MDNVMKSGKKKGWTTQQFNEALMKIVSEERQFLRKGERALNKNHR